MRRREAVTAEIKIQLDRRTQKRQKKMRQGQGLARILEYADETPSTVLNKRWTAKVDKFPSTRTEKFSEK